MKRWIGTAVICMNEKNEFLMVLQGKVNEEKRWSVPSGGQEEGEELEECCVREVWEETGYEVEVIDKLCEKKGDNIWGTSSCVLLYGKVNRR